MLRKQMETYISKTLNGDTIELYTEEKAYVKKHQLLADDITIEEIENTTRFTDAYIELSDKETEELIKEETAAFLTQPLEYLKTNKNEFLYFESSWFDLIGVEALSLEVDDVFGTYNAMFGLKFQKKMGDALKAYFNQELQGDMGTFSMIFNQGDGLWDVNFALNAVQGFKEEMTLGEAFQLIYHFLFNLNEAIEEEQ
ncbi:branched-chain amino acid aminotransferase [Peribacillus sp. NPDC097198]|uniref:branched-chain amino acid aminotransferase n=1 Tax=Peribacillus sp. NPDC097198 TaxID=3364397 RepID=UPI003802E23F